MKFIRRYRELYAIAQELANLGIDRNTQWLEQQHPEYVLALLKDRAIRVLR